MVRIAISALFFGSFMAKTIATMLEEQGYKTEIFTVTPSDDESPEDFEISERFHKKDHDLIIVLGDGSQNAFSKTVEKLTGKVIYLSTGGFPQLNQRDNIRVVEINRDFEIEHLVKPIQELIG